MRSIVGWFWKIWHSRAVIYDFSCCIYRIEGGENNGSSFARVERNEEIKSRGYTIYLLKLAVKHDKRSKSIFYTHVYTYLHMRAEEKEWE